MSSGPGSIKYGSIQFPKPERRRGSYMRDRAARLLTAGMCIACGQVPVTRFQKCLRCRVKARASRAAS